MAKYKIIPSSRTIVQSPISIGHKAEKGVEAIEFDLTAWVETYGSGTLTVIMRRWGDAIPYPIALEIDENNKATWTLSDTDTAKAGMAYAQLNYIVGDEVVKKSDIYTFRVMDSLTGEGEPPEAYESWLEHLTHLAAEAMAEVFDIEGIVTDKTLTVDGGIADAKATGDALSALEDQFTEETDKLKADLDDVINVASKTVYTDVTAVNNHVGNRVYYSHQYNRIAQTGEGTTRAYSVYAVTKGKYRIYGYGFDSEQGVFAVVGDNDLIASGSASVGLLQVIETDKNVYGWYSVETEINQDGYLYVNYQTAQNPKVEAIVSVTKYTTNKNGVYVSNGEYYHFVATKETNLIRKFARRGPNNLFQLTGTYTGSVDENGLTIESTIDVYNTDIIGPLSIWNNTLWPGVYGMWAGGNHGRTVDGTVYPTAEQADFACLVDGLEVSTDGVYYGDVIFKVKNKVYFPQSITNSDLTSATQALNEYRTYYLDSKMSVKVRLEFVEDTRISTYYGMQAVTVAYDTISAFNNNFCKSKADITEALNLAQTENKLSLHNKTTGLTLDMELMPVGMGNYQFNTGTGTGASAGYVYIPIQTGSNRTEKVYYMLAINTSADKVKSGMSLFWEGKYLLYFE